LFLFFCFVWCVNSVTVFFFEEGVVNGGPTIREAV
jgi:hypothetical protein